MMQNPEKPSLAAGIDVRTTIRQAAVRLINSGGVPAATVPAVCVEAGIDETGFRTRFDTANDVFVDIARFMMAAYGEGIGATLVRRRSLYGSIRVAQHAFLDVVESHLDTQHALTVLRTAAISDPALGVPADSRVSLQEEFITNSELWLVEMGRIHAVNWELPIRLLAAQVSASMTGMVLDHLARRDDAASRGMVDIIAFDLARRARREHKNALY
jgi:AcrR family transcriptional regulator